MKTTAISLALLALLCLPAMAEEEAGASSWILSGGAALGSDAGNVPFGSGWFIEVDTPAVAPNWTITASYADFGSHEGLLGFRRWFGTPNTWLWFGGGVGMVKREDTNQVRNAFYGEGGMAWTFTDHLGWMVKVDLLAVETLERDAQFNESTSWEFGPSVKTGLSIIF